MKNFAFLEKLFPSLANLGNLAEAYRQSDPNSALMKLGMLCESIVSLMFKYDQVREPYENTLVMKINTLHREGLLPKDLADIMHLVRKARNRAAHQGWGDEQTVSKYLPMVHSLAGWFAKTYMQPDLEIPQYTLTPVTHEPVDVLEGKEAQLQRQDESKAEHSTPIDKSERTSRAAWAAEKRPRTEAETRLLIDEQLRDAGWEADTENLRYACGTRPEDGRNLAIAEWPTDSTVNQRGRADYALFMGKTLVAVIEAKAYHEDIHSVLDYQASDYAKTIKPEHYSLTLGQWGEYRVPFLFATNARPYLEQFKTKSGVWFHDVRDALNAPRALHGWPSPEGLQAMLDADKEKANRTLTSYSDDLLTDPGGLNLRRYQVDAVHAAEDAIAGGQTHVLLAMATGTGKTRTVLGMIYRFLKSKRFRRVLYLVDRRALGEQALDTLKDVKLEELMSLDQLYNIRGLEAVGIDPETKIRVATVQAMVKQVFYPSDETIPAVTDYDLIIVDEAHRGYLLDKEMTEDEVLYRDQFDYQSAYRNLIDYFDATKIALTATPALHTTEIFGAPVYTYSYREAVMDGWLVDHDAPHRLTTKLSTEGISFGKGETLPIYDSQTGEITNSEKLADEVIFNIDQFNRKVITEEFNRTVLTEISHDLDPSSPDQFGKTLIYAVDDAHADMIVAILKEIYAASGVEPESIMKITGSVAGGNKTKIQEVIKRFKNERYPSIAVTVDLLTTGIDVPSITSLVFMRRVKSRILFEQMLGRATRLCPEIGKDKFDIYDPVGVYDALEQVNTMKPVAADPNTHFTDFVERLTIVESADSLKFIIEQILAKLQRRKQRMKPAVAEQITDLAGGWTISEVVKQLKQLSPKDAAAWIQNHENLFAYLDSPATGEPRRMVISHQPDKLLNHTLDFGDTDSPNNYIQEFTEFIENHTDEIAALKIICTKPATLDRKQLKSLRLALDRAGFTEQKLSSAVSKLSNKEIVADIISLVRRYAIGSPLISHSERVRYAIDKLKADHNFSKIELGCLSRIEQYLENELLLRPEVFDEDPRFRQQGGFKHVDFIFGNNLNTVINEFNTNYYDDKESVA